MLADPRAARALVDNFAAQWLNLRRVGEVVVDPDLYPDFDDSLLEAFKQETRLFVGSTLDEDRSVLDLLRANYTFVNERLARHYGIPGIYGSRFRRVTLPNLDQRGGLLGHGSMLATTSYPNRTSPVLRGKWLLDNIFGTPAPPPPPGVNTTLEEPKPAPCRRRSANGSPQHRSNPAVRSCHAVIDPLGFALENFDAIGGWRTIDEVGQAGRRERHHRRAARRSTACRACAPLLLEQPEQFPAHGDREAAGVRARPAARVLRSAGRAPDRARRGGRRLPLVVAGPGHCEESRVPDAGPANVATN